METSSVVTQGTTPALASAADARTIATRFVAVLVLVALDLWSKAAVFKWMQPLVRAHELPYDPCGHERYPIAGEWFTFMLQLNPGAAFGQLDSVPYLLVFGRIGAALFLVWLIARAKLGRPVFNTALVLVLAGALGNLYDNLARVRDLDLDARYAERPFGPVRDFIDVYFSAWEWHFPTFNVADSCITVGAVLIFACAFFAPKPEPKPAAGPAEAPHA
ncbi:MAG: signal peptidase II [Planctomycetes bacterium]|nr:signal peptidase II [Planctomycetota bacterium]